VKGQYKSMKGQYQSRKVVIDLSSRYILFTSYWNIRVHQ